jgi:hypothetical protein
MNSDNIRSCFGSIRLRQSVCENAVAGMWGGLSAQCHLVFPESRLWRLVGRGHALPEPFSKFGKKPWLLCRLPKQPQKADWQGMALPHKGPVP